MENGLKKSFRKKAGCILVMCALYIATFVMNLPNEKTMNVTNSDATWHTLLVAQCMDEVPASVHKFLPIVTLGSEENKNIPWGDCVPDQYGNYYYTSFPPLSFIIPYFFMKIPGIGINPFALYLLSGLLGLVACMLLYRLITDLFGEKLQGGFLLCALLALYLSASEMLHCNAQVFWAQHLYQPIMILQLCLLYQYVSHMGKARVKYLCFLVCVSFIGCFLEWAAYLMNAGIVVCMILKHYRDKAKIGDKGVGFDPIWIILSTMAAGAAIITHFLLVVDVRDFCAVLLKRFMSRNLSNRVLIGRYHIWEEYLASFGVAIVLVICLCVIVFGNRSFREKWKSERTGNAVLVVYAAGIVCLENLLLAQHALEYTYDRMKIGVFLLLAFLYMLSLFVTDKDSVFQKMLLYILTAVTLMNVVFFCFTESRYYRYMGDAYEKNELLADALGKRYTKENSVYGQISITAVRGYSTLLFGRNLYETQTSDSLENVAQQQNRRYAVLLFGDWDHWQKNCYRGAVISDLQENRREVLTIQNGMPVCEEMQETDIRALPYSDETQDLGVFPDTTIVRMELTDRNKELLTGATALRDQNGVEYPIAYVTYYDTCIDVQLIGNTEVKEKIDALMFPNTFEIVKEEQE